jgi:hypothetical protein
MRAAIITLGGLTLLGLLSLLGTRLGGSISMVTAAQIFIPVWFVAVLINMWAGVSRAGYSVADELPLLLVAFAIPVAVAVFVWWYFA